MNVKARALSLAVKLARPMWRVLEPPLAARFVHRSSWNEYLPAFLNAASTVGAFGHELSNLRGDFETMRACVESLDRRMRAGASFAGQPDGNSLAQFAPVVIAHDKITVAQGAGLKVNLGCGYLPRDGYVNVDHRELPGVDVLATADDLPFESETVHELFTVHLLEHFPEEMLRRKLLPYWYRLLRPGGLFRSVVAVNLFSPDSLGQLLQDAGFHEIRVPRKGQENDESFDFEIAASRPD